MGLGEREGVYQGDENGIGREGVYQGDENGIGREGVYQGDENGIVREGVYQGDENGIGRDRVCTKGMRMGLEERVCTKGMRMGLGEREGVYQRDENGIGRKSHSGLTTKSRCYHCYLRTVLDGISCEDRSEVDTVGQHPYKIYINCLFCIIHPPSLLALNP